MNSTWIELLTATGIGAATSGVITSMVNSFLYSKKNKAITRGAELDNIDKAVTIWRNLADELKRDVAELKKEVEGLREENAQLKDLVNQLRNQIA